MKQSSDLDKKIEETINCLDNINKATPGAFFFTRVQARLQRNRQGVWGKLGAFMLRPVVVLATIIVIITLNIAVVYRELPDTASFADQSEQVFDEEYSLALTNIYDDENQER